MNLGKPARPVRDTRGHRLSELRVHVAAATPGAGGRGEGRVAQVTALGDHAGRLLRGRGGGARAVRAARRRGCRRRRDRSLRQLWDLRCSGERTVREGQKIIILEDQFPSNVYAWRELAERSGAKLVTLPRPEDLDWGRALLEEIDADTAVVAVPNCHWTDGSLVDLARVGERVREVGGGAGRRRDTVAWGASIRRLGGSARLPRRLIVQVAARTVWGRVHVRRGGVSGGEAHRAQLDQPPRKPGLLGGW